MTSKECNYVTVKIIKGKNSDAHIIFDECDEGFHVGITDHGKDSIKSFVGESQNVKIYKTYKSALDNAKKHI